ncbi:MAG: alkaline phosphatase family protein [Nanoarchaeota archaeon]
MKNSVLIIGIDGADWNLLIPWIKEGKLPTLKRLLSVGIKADLKTTIPPLSCSAWTSLFTGRNPGKHGIYQYATESGKIVDSRLIKSEKIWQTLSQYNKRCCVINVPMTYPVEQINGYMISDFLTFRDEESYFYPSELKTLLDKHDYQSGMKYEKYAFLPDEKDISKKKHEIVKELASITGKRYETVIDIMNEPWDFFMFVFGETAVVQYLFWDKKDVMLEFFQKIDSYLNELIKIFSVKNPNPYIFVVSDHGYDSSPTRCFNFKAWLGENEILRDKRNLLHKIIPKVYRTLKRTSLSKLLFLYKTPKEMRESFQRKITESSPIHYLYPGLFIKQDRLKKETYEKLRDDIILKLRAMHDPLNKEEIFQIVEKRELEYSGNELQYAPDIVVIPKNNYSIVFSYESNKVLDDIKLHHPGRHFTSMHGIFLACGNQIKRDVLEKVSILDVYPTVLHILGVPIPQDVDGKVIKGIFKKDSDLFIKEVILSGESDMELDEQSKIKSALKNIKI